MPNAFDDRDRQFLEIYGRNVASALNTLELLQAEKFTAATASVEAISRELALPLDDILNDATTVLDRYAGHDEDIIARLRHLLYRAREIRSLIQKVGSTIAPEPKRTAPRPAPRLAGDAGPGGRCRRGDPALGAPSARLPGGDRRDGPRRARGDRPGAADALHGRPGRHPPARPRRLRGLQATPRGAARRADHPHDRASATTPRTRSSRPARRACKPVLYKPFRADRLMDAVEQALRTPASRRPRRAPVPRTGRHRPRHHATDRSTASRRHSLPGQHSARAAAPARRVRPPRPPFMSLDLDSSARRPGPPGPCRTRRSSSPTSPTRSALADRWVDRIKLRPAGARSRHRPPLIVRSAGRRAAGALALAAAGLCAWPAWRRC